MTFRENIEEREWSWICLPLSSVCSALVSWMVKYGNFIFYIFILLYFISSTLFYMFLFLVYFIYVLFLQVWKKYILRSTEVGSLGLVFELVNAKVLIFLFFSFLFYYFSLFFCHLNFISCIFFFYFFIMYLLFIY